MSIKDIVQSKYQTLLKWAKWHLAESLEKLSKKYAELEKQIRQLKEENKKLKAQKVKAINQEVNKPSSKQPEWDNNGVGNDGKGTKKGKGRGKKPRKGAGGVCQASCRLNQLFQSNPNS